MTKLGEEKLEALITGANDFLSKPFPRIGERICRSMRNHHKRREGRGYSDGLRGKEIPLMGSIVALAEAFDAMNHRRPYREALRASEAIEILFSWPKEQWDKGLVRLFLSTLEGGKKG